MNDYQLLKVGGELFYTFDFSDRISSPGTLVSVTYTTDAAGLTLSGQIDDLSGKRSSIKIAGAAHGRLYNVRALGLTSTGESIPLDLTVRGHGA